MNFFKRLFKNPLNTGLLLPGYFENVDGREILRTTGGTYRDETGKTVEVIGERIFLVNEDMSMLVLETEVGARTFLTQDDSGNYLLQLIPPELWSKPLTVNIGIEKNCEPGFLCLQNSSEVRFDPLNHPAGHYLQPVETIQYFPQIVQDGIMSGIFVFAIAVGNSVSELHGDGDIITGIQLAIPVISSYPFVETVE